MSIAYKEKTYRNFLNSEPLRKEVDYKKEADYSRMCMQRCPVCGLYAPIITNAHCVKEHGVTKKEIEEKYGKIRAGGR